MTVNGVGYTVARNRETHSLWLRFSHLAEMRTQQESQQKSDATTIIVKGCDKAEGRKLRC